MIWIALFKRGGSCISAVVSTAVNTNFECIITLPSTCCINTKLRVHRHASDSTRKPQNVKNLNYSLKVRIQLSDTTYSGRNRYLCDAALLFFVNQALSPQPAGVLHPGKMSTVHGNFCEAASLLVKSAPEAYDSPRRRTGCSGDIVPHTPSWRDEVLRSQPPLNSASP